MQNTEKQIKSTTSSGKKNQKNRIREAEKGNILLQNLISPIQNTDRLHTNIKSKTKSNENGKKI